MTNQELQAIKDGCQSLLLQIERRGETPERMYGGRVAELLKDHVALIDEVERLRKIEDYITFRGPKRARAGEPSPQIIPPEDQPFPSSGKTW